MSIEKYGKENIPTCDSCGCELGSYETWVDALHAAKDAGWRHYKDKDGMWQDRCPDCEGEE